MIIDAKSLMPKMSLKGGIIEKELEGDIVKCILHSRNMGIFILLSAFLYFSDILKYVCTTFITLIKITKKPL